MANFVSITRGEMAGFLRERNFQPVVLKGVKEIVYGRVVRKDTTLRVYTSIVGEVCRDVGGDAIRVVPVFRLRDENGIILKDKDGQPIIKPIGSSKRVHRVENWRANLDNRLKKWYTMLGPECPRCQSPTVEREGEFGWFHGCVQYPKCKFLLRSRRDT